MKHRQQIYLDADLGAKLNRLAAEPGSSKSAIVADALRSYIARRAARELDDLVKVRMDRVSRHLERMERDQQILLESFALFVRYQFSVTAPLSEAEQAAGRAVAQSRYQAFIEQVGRRIGSGRTLSAAFDARQAETSQREADA
jgi:predicted transcriptional regulator